jgi:hypothetical protein
MRAPSGGTISIINDKHYVGGQFVPEHGLFCGKGGAKRKLLWDRTAEGMKVYLGGTKMYELVVHRGGGEWMTLGLAIAESGEQAAAAFQAGRSRKVEAWKR